MPEIEFEVWCGCGNGLCHVTEVKGISVTVGPCDRCIEMAYQEGYDKGYDKGYSDRDSETEV